MPKNRIYIPTFISSVNYAPARVLPHIYFYNGVKACETYYVQGYSNGNTGSVISTPLEGFPYFDNYEGQDPQSGSRSLLFFNEPSVYGTTPTGSLYTNYWEDYINLIYNPRTRLINCEGIIPLANYFKMELNDIVEWRGNYYHLRAINDYNLKNGECKIQLLGPILEDVITNILPTLECGFSFTSSIATPTTTTQAPTTTTTLPITTTSTTAAPTTSTTTIQPYCVCQNVRFTNNHTRLFATLDYTPCGTTSSVRDYVPPRTSYTFCIATAPGFGYPTGPDSFYTILGSCTVPACQPTTTTAAPTTSTTAAPTTTLAPTTTTTLTPTTTTTLAPTTTTTTTPFSNCRNYTFQAGPGSPNVATYTLCGEVTQSTTSLSPNQSIVLCIRESEFRGLTGVGSTITSGSVCSVSTTTTTLAPTTTTTLTPTTTTTAAPVPPLQMYRLTGNGSGVAGTFLDFNGNLQTIERYGVGTDYKFVAYSGSVTGSTMPIPGLSVLIASASYPNFNTVTVTKLGFAGLTAYTGQGSDGVVNFISDGTGAFTRTYCWVSSSGQETYDPIGNLTLTQGSSCVGQTTTTSTTAAPTTSTTLSPTTTTTLAPTTTTTTIPGCSTWLAENTSSGFAAEVSYVPCGGAGYRNYFIGTNSSASLCVQSGQIYVDLGAATLTDLTTPCTSSLQDCLSYTITNSGGTQYTYGGKNCSNCATTLYSINAGVTVVRCFVSGTFTTSFPTFVTATAGANCNVSGSGCPI